jgi:hypothetical protein
MKPKLPSITLPLYVTTLNQSPSLLLLNLLYSQINLSRMATCGKKSSCNLQNKFVFNLTLVHNHCVRVDSKDYMKYTVITPLGKVMCFYIKSVAEMYALNTRGTLIGDEREDLKPSVLEGYYPL